MPRPSSTDALVSYTRSETQRWYDWFSANQDALDITMGLGRLESVRDLVIHIFAVELRCAERLLGEPVTSLEALPSAPLEAVWGIFGRARDKLSMYLATATDHDLDRVLTVPGSLTGDITGSARLLVYHALVHGIRHWAQIATVLRQHGHAEQWPHDLLSSAAP